MMKYLLISVIIISGVMTTDGRNVQMRNYMKNLDKDIINYCNYQAILKTNSEDSYNCMISNGDCSHIDNFTEYMKIRNNCIKEKKNSFMSGILCALVLIILMGLFN